MVSWLPLKQPLLRLHPLMVQSKLHCCPCGTCEVTIPLPSVIMADRASLLHPPKMPQLQKTSAWKWSTPSPWNSLQMQLSAVRGPNILQEFPLVSMHVAVPSTTFELNPLLVKLVSAPKYQTVLLQRVESITHPGELQVQGVLHDVQRLIATEQPVSVLQQGLQNIIECPKIIRRGNMSTLPLTLTLNLIIIRSYIHPSPSTFKLNSLECPKLVQKQIL